MSEKGSERTGPSYVLYGEANEPLKPVMRVIAPGDDSSLVTEQRLYVMAPAQYPSARRTTSSLKIGGHLSRTIGGILRNSGTPESGNTWGVGGSAVGMNLRFIRTIHLSPSLPPRERSKGARGLSSSVTIPLRSKGVAKLDKLIKDNLDNRGLVNDHVIEIVAATDVLTMAYAKIKSKPGNMTPGVDPETFDGIMQRSCIEQLSKDLRTGAFQFKPAPLALGRNQGLRPRGRVEIPKANGGTRPLGVAPPRDKIIQEAMRMILEAIYEPVFSIHSHGFRPKRSCHTALREIKQTFTAMN